jgi:CheY-like chemotaxis protein
MEGPAEQKWTTVRDIVTPQVKSAESEVAELVPGNSPAEETAGFVSVLVMHPVASTGRLIRETLENFTDCRVATTAAPLRAFELALQKPYGLFLFAMESPELSGPMLYELICKACTAGRGQKQLAPAVIFIREKDDPKLPDEMSRDVRVKDVVNKPIRIERLLESVNGVLEVRDPTLRG